MIILKQFDGANVTPADDAALYAHFDARSGIISGVEIAHLGANQISVGSGRGIVCGRTFVVEAETVLATLSASGTQNGRLLLQIDLGNADAPASFITQAASVLPDLVQEDLNEGGTLYQLVLATYTVNTTTISGLSAVAPLASIFGANGAVPIAAGGTGAVTAIAARKNIGAKVYFSLAEIGITEGRYHQIKRMFAAAGNGVIELRRTKMGCLALDPELPEGECRRLTEDEVALIDCVFDE